ncbi:MAG: hypothetical protein MZV64_25695 [Ignavibacteriales bacterium]|nr:hypothetical protein [Ignavibacteriales bacterium]
MLNSAGSARDLPEIVKPCFFLLSSERTVVSPDSIVIIPAETASQSESLSSFPAKRRADYIRRCGGKLSFIPGIIEQKILRTGLSKYLLTPAFSFLYMLY